MPDVFGGALDFEMDLKIQEIEKKLKSLDGQIAGLAKNAEKNGNKLEQSFNSAFKKVAAGLGTYFTARAMAGFTGEVAKTRGEFEQLEVAFTTMLGSKEKADELMKQVVEFASTTPFQLKDVAAGTKQLLAYGVASKDIIPTLKSLGDVSAGLSVPMERLILNYGQVRTQGKLTGRELRDFSMAGVPLVAELAKQLNVSEKAIADMVSAGEIGFPEVEQAFRSMTGEGGRFADLMDKQSKTITGRLSNIQDSWDKFLNSMGKRGSGAIYGALDAVSGLVEKLNQVTEIPLSKTLEEQRISVNALASQLFDANISLEDRNRLLNELRNINPDIVKGLEAETLNYDRLRENLQAYNEEMINRILLESKQEEIEEQNAKVAEIKGKRIEKEIQMSELAVKLNEEIQKRSAQLAKSGLDYADAAKQANDALTDENLSLEEKASRVLSIARLMSNETKTYHDLGQAVTTRLSLLSKEKKEESESNALTEAKIALMQQLGIKTKEASKSEGGTPVELFDVEKFTNQIKEAKKLYDDYQEQIKVGADKAVLDDYKRQIDTNITYQRYLNQQLEAYKNNVEARKVIFLELAKLIDDTEKKFKEQLEADISKITDDIISDQKSPELKYTSPTVDELFKNEELYKQMHDKYVDWSRKAIKKRITDTQYALKNIEGLEKDTYDELGDYLNELYDALGENSINTVRDISHVIGDLGGAFDKIDPQISKMFNSLSQAGEGFSNILAGFAPGGNVFQGIGGIIQTISAVFSLFDNSQEKEEQRLKAIELYHKSIENTIDTQNRLLERQLSLLNKIKGTDWFIESTQSVAQLNTSIADINRQIRNVKLVSTTNLFGSSHSELINTTNLTIDQLRKLADLGTGISEMWLSFNDPELLSAMGGGTLSGVISFNEQALRDLISQYDKLEEERRRLIDEINEKLTGSTYDSILSGITDAFSDGIMSVEEFAGSFEDIMKKAIMKSFQTQFLEKQLSGWYDQFAEATQGGLTEAEIEALRNSLQVVVSDAQKGLNDIINVSGIDFAGGSVAKESALAGAIKGITEDTANVLAGQFNAMRINGIQQLQVAQNSLTVLSRIEGNTRYNMLLRDILIEIKNQNANSLLNDRANGR